MRMRLFTRSSSACGAAVAALLASFVLLVTVSGPAADPELPQDHRLGKKIADFTLRDYHGQTHSLGEDQNQKLVVVAFLGVDCPLGKLYGPRLNEIAAKFGPQGVAFLGIDSNRQYTMTDLAAYARRFDISFPLLKDPDNAIADRFGAERMSEVFVLDQQRVVRYHGTIDDQYEVGYQRPEPKRRHLSLALEELLAGKSVSQASTKAVGCLIGRIPKVAPHGDVTYTNQIARILNQRCVECHRQGEVGPFPLTNYEQVVGWADMIREVVEQRRMPVWLADPKYGKFSNDCRLPDDDVKLISTWAANGAPEGDPKDLPQAPQFIAGWRIPQPNLVLFMSDESFTVPAEGTVEYKYFTVDPGFKEDVWIKAAEARPGNPAVVHHHMAYFVPPGEEERGQAEMKNQIVGYAPGTPPYMYPSGVGMRIPKGSKIIFQMHYTPVGVAQPDRSSLGLVLADPKEIHREIRGELIGEFRLRIPAGDPAYNVTAKRSFNTDTLLVNLAPHMHLRGKAFRFELEHPDGRREILLDVPRYQFNWQLRYDLTEPLLVRKGSALHCRATYDNSANNPVNPDPTAVVTFGEQTWNEMMFGVIQTIDPNREVHSQ